MLRARVKHKSEAPIIVRLYEDEEEGSSAPLQHHLHRIERPKSHAKSSNHHHRFKTFLSNEWSLSLVFPYMIGCLCVAVTIEIGYILSLGAFSNGEFWNFLFGMTTTSTTTNVHGGYAYRIPGSVSTIDNYYSRPHITDPVPLIIGGSDGSGTRAFAQILEQLGVPLLVEDRGTMDVHAKEIYQGAGWPALVTQVLNVTRSASYHVNDLPKPLRDSASKEIGKFLVSLKFASMALVGAGIGKTWATSVSWAFKAPVAILLLPFFRDQLPAIKVLHIVRDGRDVALSENHSPVQKFYTSFYPDAEQRHQALWEDEEFTKDARTNVKAMQLWNDWNQQIYEYGRTYSDGKTFDVLVMRSEDLIQYPLESVIILADFVGSMKTGQQLCCLSRMSAADLGQSASNPFEDQYEAGDTDHRSGLGGGVPPMFNPDNFNQIRNRFAQQMLPKTTSKVDSTPKEDHPTVRSKARRLMEAKVDLFQSGGRIASPNEPVKPLHLQLLEDEEEGQHQRQHQALIGAGLAKPGYIQVAQMQHLLQERQAAARRERHKAPETAEKVKSRYGKWMTLLQSDPKLSNRLQQEGRESLAVFGYEPQREFLDIHPHPEWLPTCDSTVTCPDP